jgi:hypothetical protein
MSVKKLRDEYNRAVLLWYHEMQKAHEAGVDIRYWVPGPTATSRDIENLAEGMRQQHEGKEQYATGK